LPRPFVKGNRECTGEECVLAPSIVGRSSVVALLPKMILPALDLGEEAEFVPEAE
jgi:hypothetical protein